MSLVACRFTPTFGKDFPAPAGDCLLRRPRKRRGFAVLPAAAACGGRSEGRSHGGLSFPNGWGKQLPDIAHPARAALAHRGEAMAAGSC